MRGSRMSLRQMKVVSEKIIEREVPGVRARGEEKEERGSG